MIDFIRELLRFSALLIFVFLLLEVPVQLSYSTQTWDMSDWNQLDHIDAEILFVGNSRSWTTFDCEKIEQELCMSCYVLAQDGWQANMLFAKLKNYLSKNEPPKILIFQVDQSFLATRDTWYSKGQFLKFLWLDREGLFQTTKSIAGHHSYEYIVPFVRYFGYPGVYLRDALGIPNEMKRIKGFAPHPFRHEEIGPLPWEYFDCKELEADWIQKFSGLVDESCLIGVWPMVTEQTHERLRNIEFIEVACLANDVRFFNLNDSQPFPDSIFKDNEHVNRLGADIATYLTIGYLKDLDCYGRSQK